MKTIIQKVTIHLKELKIRIWQKFYRSLFGLICLLSFTTQAQTPKATHLGLVAELTYLNRQATQMALMILNDTNLKAKVKIDFSRDYYQTKTVSDQIILQLQIDIETTESIKMFQKLDRLLVGKTIEELDKNDLQEKASNYIAALKLYYEMTIKLKQYHKYAKIAYEVAEVFNQADFALSRLCVEKNNDMYALLRESIKKTNNPQEHAEAKLSGLLHELRLQPMSRLIK